VSLTKSPVTRRKQTPAQRARQRRDPAVGLPTQPPRAERDLGALNLSLPQGNYLIGPRLMPIGTREDTMEGASQVTLTANDPDGGIVRLLGTDAQRLSDGVRIDLDGIVYVLTAVQAAGDLSLTLVFEDEVAWRLRRYSRYLSADRASTTRAEFILSLVDEASRSPSLPMRAFIPELTDRQPILIPKVAKASAASGITRTTKTRNLLPAKKTATRRSPAATVRAGHPGRSQGTGVVSVKVKGAKATAAQVQVIGGALAAAKALGASRRVMIAVVMCMTVESDCLILLHGDNVRNDTIGAFQQGPEFIAPANVKDIAKATAAFLLGGDANVGGTDHSKKGWKQIAGSVASAPGDLGATIARVQIGPPGSAYNAYLTEATSTVDTFLGGSAVFSGATAAGAGSSVPVPYLFERGTRDGSTRKNSWDCSGDLAAEVRFRRWACLNTLNFVSDDELIAAAPSLQITGDEPWLLAPPTWDWGAARINATVTLRVLSDRWGVLPGAVVYLSGQGAVDGRYLVLSVRDDLYSPESEIVLTRPIEKAAEPPQQTTTTGGGGGLTGTAGSGTADAYFAAAKAISDAHGPYLYGGGHGPNLQGLTATSNGGLDCSSSTCLALFNAGLFKGSHAIVSGDFGQWGQPGEGQTFTIWYSGGHVYTKFKGQYAGYEFNTGGHSGDRGPRLLKQSRPTAGMLPRHYPGL
jgi:hypothetical protein